MSCNCQNSDRTLGTLSSPQRNNYFYGKLMDVPHFDMEQRYAVKKQWLLNRLSLGSGVLCGLKLSIEDDKLKLSPGVAVDGLGREIIVPHHVLIDPWKQTKDCGCTDEPALAKDQAHEVYICLAYKECFTDFLPVLVTDCNTKQECLPGTRVEGYCILVKEGAYNPNKALHEKLCEIAQSNRTEQEKRQGLCELISGSDCGVPDGQEVCVYLGSVSLGDNARIDDMKQCDQRSNLLSNEHLLDLLLCSSEKGGKPPENVALTKVIDVSWKYDGKLSHDWKLPIGSFMQGLTVTFSDKVKDVPSIKPAVFIVDVEYHDGKITTEGVQGNVERRIVPPGTILIQRVLPHQVYIIKEKITFVPDPLFKDSFNATRAWLRTQRVYARVTVKCDFLLDSQNRPVDGNFLRGTLPSGDGVPGGDFVSWFELSDEPSEPAAIDPDGNVIEE